MSAVDERKALEKLGNSYRRLITGDRVPPAEPAAEAAPAQLPAPQQKPHAAPATVPPPETS